MPNKKPVNKTTDDPKPITLIVTIYPPKKGQRHVMVSGAPEGEMPLLFTGIFQERHALLDQAFAGVLKREPQIVTLKDDKPGKPDKAKSITGDASDDETEEAESKEAASDQLVTVAEVSEPDSAESVPVSPITSADDLPVIDGDTATSDDVQRFEAALEDIKAEQPAALEGVPYYKTPAKKIAYGTFEKLKAEQADAADESEDNDNG